MSSSQQTPTTTRMFARVLGPLLFIACTTAVVRGPDMRALLSDFAANALWPWVTGALVLAGGLIIVALHQHWRGAAAFIVSLSGWLMVLRGVLLLAFPATFESMANSVVNMGALWRGVCIVLAAIGLYLTYVGWAPATRPHEVNDHARPAPA
jgi:glucose uptake protein GlcU